MLGAGMLQSLAPHPLDGRLIVTPHHSHHVLRRAGHLAYPRLIPLRVLDRLAHGHVLRLRRRRSDRRLSLARPSDGIATKAHHRTTHTPPRRLAVGPAGVGPHL